MSQAQPERRGDPRFHARFDVRFRQPSDAAKAFNAFSVNFSAGGLCLRAQLSHDIGEPLLLDLTIGEQQFALEGVVAWRRGKAIGVRFVNLAPQARERLDAVAAMFATNACPVDWGTTGDGIDVDLNDVE